MGEPYRLSRIAYRAVLRLYPVSFRQRFGRDLESDFAQLLARQGVASAWVETLKDLWRSIGETYAHARIERRGLIYGRLRVPNDPGGSFMASLLLDVRHAIRGLIKTPVFTIVTVATLALGIGANSAIFSLVNAVLLRPMGYQQPERLMLIYEGIPEADIQRFGVSPPDFADLADYQRSFDAIGAYRTRELELSGLGEPEQIVVGQLTSTVFPILGVNAATGRTFLPSDDQNQLVAVISHGLWQRRFGARGIVGERLMLDRQPYTIVGIMPASFQFPKRGPQLNGEPAEIWVPLVFNPFERQARGMFYNHTVVGRLREGVSVEQATADTAALASRIRDNYPAMLRNSPFSLVVTAVPLLDEVAGQVRQPLLILLGAVGFVLLVACANVANLILSRSVVREREIGLRTALGAARYRLFQMLLTESLLLAFAGGALGLLVGHWTLRAMPAVITTSLPGVSDVTLDARVVAFAFGLSALTALVFGLVPLVAGTRRDLHDLLRDSATLRPAARASTACKPASSLPASRLLSCCSSAPGC